MSYDIALVMNVITFAKISIISEIPKLIGIFLSFHVILLTWGAVNYQTPLFLRQAVKRDGVTKRDAIRDYLFWGTPR